MKLCVFSDIHGNREAWEKSLPAILGEKADWNIFLGDLCGYYFDAPAVLATLATMENLIPILGNHDKMFIDMCAGDVELRERYRREYGESFEILSADGNISDLREWVEKLAPISCLSELGVCCMHGAPDALLDGYVYPDTNIPEKWFDDTRILLMGHTHYRMYRKVHGGIAVNPGSIGQPRDGGRSSYAVIDTNSLEVAFRPIEWDVNQLSSRLESDGYKGAYLHTVLSRMEE